MNAFRIKGTQRMLEVSVRESEEGWVECDDGHHISADKSQT